MLAKQPAAPARARNKYSGHFNVPCARAHMKENLMRCLVKVSIVVDVAACLRAVAVILSLML